MECRIIMLDISMYQMAYIEPDKPQNICFLQWNIAKEVIDDNITLDYESDSDSKDNVRSDSRLAFVDKIFPPREWMVKNELGEKKWRQTISKKLPTRVDIANTNTMIKVYEEFYGVRKKGICDLRSALYVSYFDEALRHIALIDETLGELLYIIREDLRNTVITYQILHDKTLSYKGMYIEQSLYEQEMVQEIERLTKVNDEYELKIEKMKAELKKFRENTQVRNAHTLEKHQVSVKALTRSVNQLTDQLNTLMPLLKVGEKPDTTNS
ncbi:33 kDa inner dynein arm light chain, axonemal-like isoform X2 [Daktulosphaira vitifoliae]|uniref:33 kDa inner dynein arm light chain, axonemal-like isoform X2 n=1 Tax=Daktulosphaira vitifoliae TaxID=58002 RepID=UPI0021AA5148|nr:33 kDa inner dynein arm light chain, axonemal-like isoform X2 [Daktulosphaira vitifoliae]